MALSLTQQTPTLFSKSPFKSPFRESNQFFEKFNIKCLMNEQLLTPNKGNIPSFRGSSTKKGELTPISFMAINHLFNSPESKLYLKSLEKRGMKLSKKKTSNFEAKGDEFSLKLLKEDCNDDMLLNQPFSQIKLIRTYSDPVGKKKHVGKNFENGKNLDGEKNKGNIEVDLFEFLKHDLMMLEQSENEKEWSTWSSYENFEEGWMKRKLSNSSDEKVDEELDNLSQEEGVSILNYVDFEVLEDRVDLLLTNVKKKLEEIMQGESGGTTLFKERKFV